MEIYEEKRQFLTVPFAKVLSPNVVRITSVCTVQLGSEGRFAPPVRDLNVNPTVTEPDDWETSEQEKLGQQRALLLMVAGCPSLLLFLL